MLDAVNDGLIDAAHSVPVYWYGKNKAASLFGTGPVFGGSATTMLSWFYQGGGQELYNELTQDIMGLDVERLLEERGHFLRVPPHCDELLSEAAGHFFQPPLLLRPPLRRPRLF